MTPRYSIIVVSYNCLANLQACLEAVDACFQADPLGVSCGEIVVVDNASKDGTGEWLRSFERSHPHCTAVLNPDNRGFSAACNQGAARSRGEFVLFLNPDTWASPGSFGRMAEAFQDPKVGAVGPLSNYVAGLQRLDVQWPREAKPLAELMATNGRETSALISNELAQYRKGQTVETRLLIGFCLMMRRGQFHGMGGMDEALFLGNDDLDLSWRLREKGFTLKVALDAFVLHEGQKSFKTERKEIVDNLVQESTDALYRKLVAYYGSEASVPSSRVLWGMDWFKPSATALQGEVKMQPSQKSSSVKTPHESLLRDITLLIALPVGKEADSALQATLQSLPKEIGEILLLDAGESPALLPEGQAIRRLDIGPEMPVGMAMRLATRASKKTFLLLVPAGLEITAMLAHWIGRRNPQELGEVFSLHVSEVNGPWAGQALPTLLRREFWLRQAPDTEANWAQLMQSLAQNRSSQSTLSDAPWLGQSRFAAILWNVEQSQTPSDQRIPSEIHSTRPADWTPVQDDVRIGLYPESLQAPLRRAKKILFVGTQAGPVIAGTPIRGVDMNGQATDLSGQDLVILRVTPDMIPDLSERLKHVRQSAHDMKQLVVVFNSNHALGIRGDEKGWHIPIDLNIVGIQRALRLAGFTVQESMPYYGFIDPATQKGSLQGWHQIEAIPRSTQCAQAAKVSIVLLGFNQVEYTRKCLESIQKWTRQNTELILVDNGSTDGTWDLFKNYPNAKAIRNRENLGVAAGWNCGLREVTGDYVCILNNDTIVGEGWLENMVRLCESDSSIGMVGPRCNRIAGPQIVESVTYQRDDEIAGYIHNWNEKHALESEEHDWVKGVCMVMPRRIFDAVGFFDERFGKGNFEDDDYCLRVRLNGFKTCIAHDAYIHHYGSVSFNQAGIDWTEQMRKNQALFESKWARGKDALKDDVLVYNPDREPDQVSPQGLANQVETAGAEKSEVEQFLAEVSAAYEREDLDAARHALVKAASINEKHPEVLNALGVMSFHENNPREAAICFLRALMGRPEYVDAAHNVLDALMALNGEVSQVEMDAYAKRFPGNPVFAAQMEPKDWKSEIESHLAGESYDIAVRLLEPEMQNPDRRSSCFNYMGLIAVMMDQGEEGLSHFRRALAEPMVEPDAVMNAVEMLLGLGRMNEALDIMKQASSGGYGGIEGRQFLMEQMQMDKAMQQPKPDCKVLFRDLEAGEEAEKLLESGHPEAAKAVLEAHLTVSPSDFRAHNNLGLCAYYVGDTEAAFQSFMNALRYEPGCGDALINLCDCAMSLGRVDVMPKIVQQSLRHTPDLAEAKRLERLFQREGDAIREVNSLAELEAQQESLDAAETKLKAGEFKAARSLYDEALQRRKANPQALNGLGIMAFSETRYEEAFTRFSEAAKLNPADQDILINLWEAARAQQREKEALSFLKFSLEKHPDLTDIRAIVTSAA